jgi:hypothetical protein
MTDEIRPALTPSQVEGVQFLRRLRSAGFGPFISDDQVDAIVHGLAMLMVTAPGSTRESPPETP